MNVDRYVEVRGARIRFRTEGSGPPAVLIPGIGAPLESWEWTIAALRERYTTYAFDYPGFGYSEPVDSSFTPSGAGRTTLAFMDAVGLQRAVMIGSSLGGGIATMAAGMAPGRFVALVLAAPAGYGVRLSHMACLIALPRVGEAAAVVVKKYPRIMLRNMFADQRLIPDRLLEIAARDVARRSNIENYLKALRGLINLHGIRPDVVAEIHAAARRIIAPTLIVWGDRDRVVPSEQAPVVARNISGSQLHMMLGLGHVPFIEATETFNRKIMAFLSMAAQPVPSGIAR